ncbi:Phosphatidylserine decarboxylase [Candidatus Palibaumannia cicadellinicola]|uniref:Phosphatidylserine decarboxylase proenzyme n=1 Tax=Candidatus Palibaumannia cicadellinicola TaxID=186490 RepID=A0A0K2BM42_9GAMM|nr:Phosphatidylserine decarboxylase [Candidatus Baumannia cicadellinicola]
MLDYMQYILKLWLTQLIGWGAERNGGWLTIIVIKIFVLYYKVNMQEALEPNIANYPTFNSFFRRSLKKSARPIDTNSSVIVLPVDGIISQLGTINGEFIFQAKGHYYSLTALLAGYDNLIEKFRNGQFVTTYLSPGDYHKIHMPCNGVLRQMIYVPGDLLSVNPVNTKKINNLFARNERVICLFDTDFGSIAQISIGATIVGSITTVWSGTVTPPREGVIKCFYYPKKIVKDAIILFKGQEIGSFQLGSTVINLFSYGRVKLSDHLHTGYFTRVGKPLAYGLRCNSA